MSPKACFDDCYKLYSPKFYTQKLLKGTNYRLPFNAMALLGAYLNVIPDIESLTTAIIGSCHGLDAAALKYGYNYDDILTCWGDKDPECHQFINGDNKFHITMVDINLEPLKFAHHVGLCDNFYQCDMRQDLSVELLSFLKSDVDLLIAVGVTTYIGIENFHRLIKIVEDSNIRFFCFSLSSFVRQPYTQLFELSPLNLKELGNIDQRNYEDDVEREKILDILDAQGTATPADQENLIASVYMAT